MIMKYLMQTTQLYLEDKKIHCWEKMKLRITQNRNKKILKMKIMISQKSLF